jgi:hypothetical protein
MAATHNKQTESKYVSCFADSRPDVDITFRDLLLKRPTDHYLVGIDNFSMTNSSLSMVEPQTGTYEDLIRIVKNPSDYVCTLLDAAAAPTNGQELDDLFTGGGQHEWTGTELHADEGSFQLRIRSTEVILSMQQLMHRLGMLAADVNEYMNTDRANDTDFEFPYTADANEVTEHLRFELNTSGQITVVGTRPFWACFSIEIPSVRNQFGFYGAVDATNLPFTRLRRFMSVHPESGEVSYNKILVNRFPVAIPTEPALGLAAAQAAARAYNSRLIGGSDSQGVVVETDLDGFATHFNAHDAPDADKVHSIVLGACVFSAMERRVALEVGCSLPIKNSPMVDHGKESPDFVLGRWIWRTDPRVTSNDIGGSRQYDGAMPSCVEYQGARDRITYHELMAQSKIQTLRIRLFARMRTFNELTEEWGMRVIELPSTHSDWWHARLHFISRD